MNKKLIISIGLLIILLGGYFLFSIIKDRKKPMEIPEEEKSNLINTINFSDNWGEEFYNCIALVHDDPGFCSDFKVPDRCEAMYYWDISFFKDESFCDKLSEEQRVICLAYHKEDPSICSNIKDDLKKNECLGLVTQDENYCNKAGEESYDCIGRIKFIQAVKNKDISLCEKAKIGYFNMARICEGIILKNEDSCFVFAKELIEGYV